MVGAALTDWAVLAEFSDLLDKVDAACCGYDSSTCDNNGGYPIVCGAQCAHILVPMFTVRSATEAHNIADIVQP